MTRYLPSRKVYRLINKLPDWIEKSVLGVSVNHKAIHILRLGNGPKRLLIWSQMHGNETTTTKALFDLMSEPYISCIKDKCHELSIYIIPQLNPDGADTYTRENASKTDLNRDAINRIEPESQLLRHAYDTIKPHFCFNLHGQRTIYAAGKGGHPATLSFLAPAADANRTITPTRKDAMQLIAAIVQKLSPHLKGRIGRYNDTFNPNCVGDMFTSLGTPTLLFEAGHFPHDYQRIQSRVYVCKSLFYALQSIVTNVYSSLSPDLYFKLPANAVDYVDLVLLNVTINHNGTIFNNQSLCLNYKETLEHNAIVCKPYFVSFGNTASFKAHRIIDYKNHKITKPIFYKAQKIFDYFEFNENLALDLLI